MTTVSQSQTPKRDNVVNRTLIRGTFALSQLTPLFYLIKSLCLEVGQVGNFHDWDRVYNPAPEVKGLRNNIRLRQHLVSAAAQQGQQAGKDMFPAFTLMYLGIPERRVQPPCEKRPVTSIAIGKEAEALLTVLGCTFVYEYVRKGVQYRTRSGLIIEVYTVEKLRSLHNPTQTEHVVEGDDQHGIVEIISEEGASPEELQAFMQHLHPFVSLPAAQPKRVP